MENIHVWDLIIKHLKHEEKRINQLKSIKAKGFKNNISDNDFKNVTLDEKPLRVTQKQVKSKNLAMTMEDVVKDVIPVL